MPDHGIEGFSHNPEWSAVEAMDFIDRTQQAGLRFFLYFAFTLPHMPQSGTALQRPSSSVPDHRAAAATAGSGGGGGEHQRDKFRRMAQMRERSRKHISRGKAVAAHHAAGATWYGSNDKEHNAVGLLWIDSIVGELVGHLRRRGTLDRTLVIFSADHGCIAKGHCFEPV